MRALRYAFEEALASLWRGRQSGLLSTAHDRARVVRARRISLVTANLEQPRRRSGAARRNCRCICKDDVTPPTRSRRSRPAGAERCRRRRASSCRKPTRSTRFKQTFGDLGDGHRRRRRTIRCRRRIEVHLQPGPGAAATA